MKPTYKQLKEYANWLSCEEAAQRLSLLLEKEVVRFETEGESQYNDEGGSDFWCNYIYVTFNDGSERTISWDDDEGEELNWGTPAYEFVDSCFDAIMGNDVEWASWAKGRYKEPFNLVIVNE